MEANKKIDFCTECRKECEYTLEKRNFTKMIRNKEYTFNITFAICSECGAEMSILGLVDKNVKEVDTQYRMYENIVSVDDIEKLIKIYKIGKAPLSLALGFGEVTITRYLLGQIPSKEYSDIIKKALSSPEFMIQKLQENKEKIGLVAYNKAFDAAIELKNLFIISEKMQRVISYLFEKLEEVTPLMLQKLLYFNQGESYALYNRSMFSENCYAWVHGLVYPDVYNLFRDFKYNPIEDARFAIFEGSKDQLTKEECMVIDLVVDTFGEYSGKILEKITHAENPWKFARLGYDNDIPSNELITKESIQIYYNKKNEEYDFSNVTGLKNYILDILG